MDETSSLCTFSSSDAKSVHTPSCTRSGPLPSTTHLSPVSAEVRHRPSVPSGPPRSHIATDGGMDLRPPTSLAFALHAGYAVTSAVSEGDVDIVLLLLLPRSIIVFADIVLPRSQPSPLPALKGCHHCCQWGERLRLGGRGLGVAELPLGHRAAGSLAMGNRLTPSGRSQTANGRCRFAVTIPSLA